MSDIKEKGMAVNSVKDLVVYQKSYRLAMEFFELSKAFPAEERYALTSQGRRSSRSVPMNLREAWAKRRYEAHFISKLTGLNREIGKMLGSMLNSPEKFLLTPNA